MTSRERVRKVLNHEEADRMPIDFGAMRSTGMTAVAYNNLKKYMGMQTETTKIYDIWQQLAEPEMELIERFHGDVVQLHRLAPCFGIPIDEYKMGTDVEGTPSLVAKDFSPVTNAKGDQLLRDEEGTVIAHLPAGGYYYDQVAHPLADAETKEDIDNRIDFSVMSQREIQWLREEARRLYEETDKAILGEFVGSVIYESGQYDFGYDVYYENLILEKELVHHYNRRRIDMLKESVKLYLDAVGDYIDIIHMGDDLGTQQAPQISMEMYREMVKPYHKELFQYIHQLRPDIKVFFHCCGSIYPFIEDLIDSGVDILNPVQLTAENMDARQLKEEFGDRLTFWGGGCNMTTTASRGSIEDIEKEVKELSGIFKKGGGYVFNQVHNIQNDIGPEKVIAIYDTAYQCGAYGQE